MSVSSNETNIDGADSANAEYSPNQPAFKSVPRSGPVRNNFQSLAKMNELRIGIDRDDRTKLVINPGHYFKDRQNVAFVAEESGYSLNAPQGEARGSQQWLLLGLDTDEANPNVATHAKGSSGNLPEIPPEVAPLAFVQDIDSGVEFQPNNIIDARNIVRPPRIQDSNTF